MGLRLRINKVNSLKNGGGTFIEGEEWERSLDKREQVEQNDRERMEETI